MGNQLPAGENKPSIIVEAVMMEATDSNGDAHSLFRIEQHSAALKLALCVGDHVVALVAAARLQVSLSNAANRATASGLPVSAIAALQAVTDEVLTRFTLPPARVHRDDVLRLLRWVEAVSRFSDTYPPSDSPDVYRLDACAVNLSEMSLSRLHVVQSRFSASNMSGVAFDECVLEDCDLSRTNLERTTWRAAKVTACSLPGTSMVDATLDGAWLVDCDLRGADLAVEIRGAMATTFGAVFIRCDLRETNWKGRTLAGVKMLDCKLYGARGAPIDTGVEIVGPDLSPKGDGSEIQNQSEVRRRWRT